MRTLVIAVVAAVAGATVWAGIAAWRWPHTDMAAVFDSRIRAETPKGESLAIMPGTIQVGDLSDTSRLVCGTVLRQGADGKRVETTYSLVVIKTLFGHAINDGYTPASTPDNQALSEQNCAALHAHIAANPVNNHP